MNNIDGLKRYLNCSYLTPSNSVSQKSVKKIINWRNNSLFAGASTGAIAGCVLETIIQTGKMNDLEPSLYLQYLMNIIK